MLQLQPLDLDMVAAAASRDSEMVAVAANRDSKIVEAAAAIG